MVNDMRDMPDKSDRDYRDMFLSPSLPLSPTPSTPLSVSRSRSVSVSVFVFASLSISPFIFGREGRGKREVSKPYPQRGRSPWEDL